MTTTLPDNAFRGNLLSDAANLPQHWQAALQRCDVQAALEQLDAFLSQRLTEGAVIFPTHPFKALHGLPPEAVRVIILGQDPYHGPGQAQGLAFSVPDHCPCPPSLRNIFSEIAREFPDQLTVQSNNLERWVKQGVLLLNTVLTVESGQPASHSRRGWETVTDALIEHVACAPQPKVFMLWGNHAQQKQPLIPANNNTLVLRSNHPSPLSARRPPVPFLGCNHFAQANIWLLEKACLPIKWG